MRIEFHHVDAFTRRPFGGNPAGVCRLDEALDDETMQSIAAEFNLPATSFFWPDGDGFTLRWFAPAVELQLCGHGTLATGHVLLNVLERERHGARFGTRAGALHVERDGDRIALDLPALPVHTQHPPEIAARALGVVPEALWEADRAMAVLADASQVRDLRPDFDAIAALPFPSVIVTARGFDGDCDFVSRYFAPKYGIPEDFVTGSAHCVTTPYWALALGKTALFARQLSSRGGELWLEDRGDRVRVAGTCVPIATGTLTL